MTRPDPGLAPLTFRRLPWTPAKTVDSKKYLDDPDAALGKPAGTVSREAVSPGKEKA